LGTGIHRGSAVLLREKLISFAFSKKFIISFALLSGKISYSLFCMLFIILGAYFESLKK
jgi:hypothetical protein